MATPPPEATVPADPEGSVLMQRERSSSHGEDMRPEHTSISPEIPASLEAVPSTSQEPTATQSEALHPAPEHTPSKSLSIHNSEEYKTNEDEIGVPYMTSSRNLVIDQSKSPDPHSADQTARSPGSAATQHYDHVGKASLADDEETATGLGTKDGPAGSDDPLLKATESAACVATDEVPRAEKSLSAEIKETEVGTKKEHHATAFNVPLLKDFTRILALCIVYCSPSKSSNTKNEGPKAGDVSQKPNSRKVERSIKSLSSEEFKSSTPSFHRNTKRSGHLISDSPSRNLYAIEVLSNESSYPGSRLPRRRYIQHRQPEASAADPLPPNIPDRIRIRSTYLLDLLQHITDVKLNHGGQKVSVEDQDSLIFLHPFKFFVTFADKIKAEKDRLGLKFCDDNKPQHSQTATGSTSPPVAEKPMLESAPGDTVAPANKEEDFESKDALEYLELIMELVEQHLKPVTELRDAYRNGTRNTITFQNLWLLFEVGGLLFEREPQPDHPPQISRMIHFSGGRQILNSTDFKTPEARRDIPGTNSKGLENQFCIHHYSLGFNGERYGPIPDRMTMPSWEGERSVFDLKLFPLHFVRNFKDHPFESLEQYKGHIRKRGENFMTLGPIDHRYYSGEGIGAHREPYNSPVVIDFKLQKRDTEQGSGLLGWMETVVRSEFDIVSGLTIYAGDHREVQEGASREDNPECIYPGCDNNDFIHDDILLDSLIAERKLREYGKTSAKFEPNEKASLTEDDILLFPSFIHGYVLKNRVWRKLHLDSLKSIQDKGNRFDALRIPQKHKNSLRAFVSLCDKRSSDYPALDVVSGKGQGMIILLHGKAGVGKTATAEAMAADSKRPLYPITYADLGEKPSTVETNLRRIFRYGQRWNCILLLDEADVFLAQRGLSETQRNSIVSIFLRNLEWYPGLIFLTTNLLKDFDEAILDRIHLKLHYPPLDEKFTEDIFNDHFRRINEEHPLSREEHEAQNVRYHVSEDEMDEIRTWRKERYPEPGSQNWLNGRQIRLMFQMAMAFARTDMVKNNGTIANIEVRYFKTIAESMDDFRSDLSNATDGRT